MQHPRRARQLDEATRLTSDLRIVREQRSPEKHTPRRLESGCRWQLPDDLRPPFVFTADDRASRQPPAGAGRGVPPQTRRRGRGAGRPGQRSALRANELLDGTWRAACLLRLNHPWGAQPRPWSPWLMTLVFGSSGSRSSRRSWSGPNPPAAQDDESVRATRTGETHSRASAAIAPRGERVQRN